MDNNHDYRVKVFDRDGNIVSDQSWDEYYKNILEPGSPAWPRVAADIAGPGNIFLTLMRMAAENEETIAILPRPHLPDVLITKIPGYAYGSSGGWVPPDPDS